MAHNEVISWIDANGVEHILSGHDGIDVLKGPNGRFMPPVSYLEEEVPFEAGSRVRQVKIGARDVDLPIEISATDNGQMRGKLRELLKAFNPSLGEGRLKSVAPDGVQRELICRYNGGLEIQESGMNWERIVLILRANDPYWYDTNTNVQTFQTGEPATFFPFFPLRLASSTVFADVSINNTGDVETWPEWIITGPGENIVLRNLTTGELLQLQTALGEGEILTIDTKPRKKSIKKGDGTNLFSTQNEGSSLWALQSGSNNIRIEMSNSTLRSSVQLTYKNRYWSP